MFLHRYGLGGGPVGKTFTDCYCGMRGRLNRDGRSIEPRIAMRGLRVGVEQDVLTQGCKAARSESGLRALLGMCVILLWKTKDVSEDACNLTGGALLPCADARGMLGDATVQRAGQSSSRVGVSRGRGGGSSKPQSKSPGSTTGSTHDPGCARPYRISSARSSPPSRVSSKPGRRDTRPPDAVGAN